MDDDTVGLSKREESQHLAQTLTAVREEPSGSEKEMARKDDGGRTGKMKAKEPGM